MEYDDGLIACADDGLVIRRYTLLLRPRRVPYGDLRHRWNFDGHRPSKEVALVLDVGKRVRPAITPDEPKRVVAVLRKHGVPIREPA